MYALQKYVLHMSFACFLTINRTEFLKFVLSKRNGISHKLERTVASTHNNHFYDDFPNFEPIMSYFLRMFLKVLSFTWWLPFLFLNFFLGKFPSWLFVLMANILLSLTLLPQKYFGIITFLNAIWTMFDITDGFVGVTHWKGGEHGGFKNSKNGPFL